MINKLTKKQEAQLQVYRDKWLKIGLQTGPANRSSAEQAVKDAYKVAGLEPPKFIIWAQSPISGLITVKYLKEFLKKYTRNGEVGASVWDSVWDSVGASVRDSVGDSVWDSVRDSVRDSVLQQEWNELYCWGQHDANWLGFYDYFKEVCDLKVCEKLEPLSRLAKEAGWTWLYKNAAIISERPTELHVVWNETRKRYIMHNPNGAAIKWADGYQLFRMNGIEVPEKLVMTQAKELNAKEWLKEENVDIRRCAFEKIGIEKVVSDLGADTIDTFTCKKGGKYELLALDIGLEEKKLYLRMNNPSIKAIHLEGVDNSCKTVKEAIAWRNGLAEYQEPIFLT